MLGRLVTQWTDIIGTDLAARTAPAGLKRYKSEGAYRICLDIAASAADAATLIYRQDIIIEKINRFLGEETVSAIRFVPTTAHKSALSRRKTTKILTPEEKTYLSGVVEAVADADIKESLQALGTAILQDRKS